MHCLTKRFNRDQNKEDEWNQNDNVLCSKSIQDPEFQSRLSDKSCTTSANWHYTKVSSTDALENPTACRQSISEYKPS